jgi:WD40 repeat protein
MKAFERSSSLFMGMVMVVAGACACCSRGASDEYFSDDCLVWAEADVATRDTLRAAAVSEEVLGAYKLTVVDTILCVSTTSMPTLFQLCNLSGDSITSIGFRGHGPDDFTSNRTCGQTFRENGEVGLWVVDVNNAKLKRLNLTRSIIANQSVVDSIVGVEPLVKNAFVSDGRLIQETMLAENFKLKISRDDSDLYDKQLYKLDFDGGRSFMAYNTSMALSPSGRYLVMAMMAVNQINLIDMSTMSRRAVVVGEPTQSDKIFADGESTSQWSYYTSVTLSDDYVYALYENQPFDYAEDYVMQPCSVHILRFDGSVVAVVPLDRYISSISVAPDNGTLYGLSEDNRICTYHLAGVLGK